MPELTLHMGSGKTGSSSVQALLADRREDLLDRGVLYPVSPGRVRHVRLGLSLREDEQLRQQPSWEQQGYDDPAAFRSWFGGALAEEVAAARPERVLMSDEALFGANAGMLDRLRALTDTLGEPLQLVVYLRRQDDHLASRYQQVVKTGETRRLVERMAGTDFTGVYDYLGRLRLWQRRLEPASITVRPFERSAFPGGSLLADFVRATGLGLDVDDDAVGVRNASLDAETVEFLRLVNVLKQDGLLPGWRVRQQRRLVDQLTTVSSGPTLTLPDADLETFMAPWAEGNRTVAREFVGAADGELFHAARKTAGTTTEQRLDPARVDPLLAVVDLPDQVHGPLRDLAARAAREH